MREIYYNSDITPKTINEIKLLTLYYDKVTIVNDVVYSPKFGNQNGKLEFFGVEDLPFIPPGFHNEYKLLIDAGVMDITRRNEGEQDHYEKLFSKRISEIVNGNDDYIFPTHPEKANGKIITEEVYDIMKHMLDFEWGDPIEKNYIWWYYSFKLKWFIKLLLEGRTCISSSNNLNHLFKIFIQETNQSNVNNEKCGRSRSLALDAIKIVLPNPDVLSLEDILELKLVLRDELGLFSQTINEIEVRNRELFYLNSNDREYQALFFSEVQKPLRDLETKIKNLKSKTFRKFVDKVKDYRTYVPLLGTVVASLPIEYAVMTSLGMTVGQSYLEYEEDHREIRNNGFYFLLKL